MNHEENTDYIGIDGNGADDHIMQNQRSARPRQGTAPLQHLHQMELCA